MDLTARVHSIETCGTVDGPGIRYVIFFQGCPLRCQYCHNADTWDTEKGEIKTTGELIKDLLKYKSYMKFSGGGVTATGGEPLLQAEFIAELFRKLKELGIHTTLDTSGFTNLKIAAPVLKYTDLVLLDIKSINPDVFKSVTRVNIDPVIAMAQYLSENKIPVWIRYVLVPSLTDNLDDIQALSNFIDTLSNVEKVDVLPFHKMGEYKWEILGEKYELHETPTPSAELLKQVNAILEH